MASAVILDTTPSAPAPAVIVREWPLNLTEPQAQAFTNWSLERLRELARDGRIVSLRDGRHGSKLYYRPSIERYMQERACGSNIDSEMDF